MAPEATQCVASVEVLNGEKGIRYPGQTAPLVLLHGQPTRASAGIPGPSNSGQLRIADLAVRSHAVPSDDVPGRYLRCSTQCVEHGLRAGCTGAVDLGPECGHGPPNGGE